MLYKLIKTDLQLNNKLIPENSEIELIEDQTKGIEKFLIPVESNKPSTPNSQSSTSTVGKVEPPVCGPAEPINNVDSQQDANDPQIKTESATKPISTAKRKNKRTK